MTPALLAQAGESLYGARWRAPLARDLGISERTVFYWLNGSINNRIAQRQLETRLAELLRDRALSMNALAMIFEE